MKIKIVKSFCNKDCFFFGRFLPKIGVQRFANHIIMATHSLGTMFASEMYCVFFIVLVFHIIFYFCILYSTNGELT